MLCCVSTSFAQVLRRATWWCERACRSAFVPAPTTLFYCHGRVRAYEDGVGGGFCSAFHEASGSSEVSSEASTHVQPPCQRPRRGGPSCVVAAPGANGLRRRCRARSLCVFPDTTGQSGSTWKTCTAPGRARGHLCSPRGRQAPPSAWVQTLCSGAQDKAGPVTLSLSRSPFRWQHLGKPA